MRASAGVGPVPFWGIWPCPAGITTATSGLGRCRLFPQGGLAPGRNDQSFSAGGGRCIPSFLVPRKAFRKTAPTVSEHVRPCLRCRPGETPGKAIEYTAFRATAFPGISARAHQGSRLCRRPVAAASLNHHATLRLLSCRRPMTVMGALAESCPF